MLRDKRESGRCELSPGRWEGTSEPLRGNPPPVPAVTGKEVRTSQVRIQVEPRTSFVRPEPKWAQGIFCSEPNNLKKERLT